MLLKKLKGITPPVASAGRPAAELRRDFNRLIDNVRKAMAGSLPPIEAKRLGTLAFENPSSSVINKGMLISKLNEINYELANTIKQLERTE